LSYCPHCGAALDPRLLAQSRTLCPPIVALITQTNPDWRIEQGICPVCTMAYAQQFALLRSEQSLHTSTIPPTTFPYYHPTEATVHAQPERLPDYPAFGGRGVTIAFLDSGYYPHPDLTASAIWPDVPDWATLPATEFEAILQKRSSRIIQYVDLTDDGERIGLDQPSLWDGAGDSWHGQMTTVLATGNGLLSSGRFRGYAPRAQVLAIKIGRGGGRIPEEDILRGLEWLLHDDNWQRYQVRVLNVSVGGDFAEPWQQNEVCRAAEALSAKGVLIAAAAGNRGRAALLAPAQAPSVLTVGGYDDGNRRLDEARSHVTRYLHNYGVVDNGRHKSTHPHYKPEILAPARWLPSPILPVTGVFREMVAIDRLRATLASLEIELEQGIDPATMLPSRQPAWLQSAWQALRQGMNAHKWVHRYYQHVDGTSVAVAQVSAVAAQIFAANPNLTGTQVRTLLLNTALPLPDQPAALVGQGILQPAQAVAAALRTSSGILAGLPCSATRLTPDELQKWSNQGRVLPTKGDPATETDKRQAIYFGYYAPQATAVSLIGSFNAWQPEALPLQPLANGWWQTVVILPHGRHVYRFWIERGPNTPGEWCADPENPLRSASGYPDWHSLVIVE